MPKKSTGYTPSKSSSSPTSKMSSPMKSPTLKPMEIPKSGVVTLGENTNTRFPKLTRPAKLAPRTPRI
jgi:hypothetical protein